VARHPATLSLPFCKRTRGENKKENSGVKVRTGRSVTNYLHGQNKFNLEKINLIYSQLK